MPRAAVRQPISRPPYHTFHMGYYLLEYALIDNHAARRAASGLHLADVEQLLGLLDRLGRLR
jgi:hypothetical protein